MDDNSPPRLAFTVTAGRVDHYNDVAEYLVQQQIQQAYQDGWSPSEEQVRIFRSKVISLAVIRHDVEAAAKLKLKPRQLLLEKRKK
jgi:hypothetical protein